MISPHVSDSDKRASLLHHPFISSHPAVDSLPNRYDLPVLHDNHPGHYSEGNCIPSTTGYGTFVDEHTFNASLSDVDNDRLRGFSALYSHIPPNSATSTFDVTWDGDLGTRQTFEPNKGLSEYPLDAVTPSFNEAVTGGLEYSVPKPGHMYDGSVLGTPEYVCPIIDIGTH